MDWRDHPPIVRGVALCRTGRGHSSHWRRRYRRGTCCARTPGARTSAARTADLGAARFLRGRRRVSGWLCDADCAAPPRTTSVSRTSDRIRLLVLSPIPEEGAGCRFRIAQFIPYLEANGFDVELRAL